MHFKLLSKLSLLLIGSASVICQELNKNILIVTTEETNSQDLATEAILQTMAKYNINKDRIKIKPTGIADKDLHDILYDTNGNPNYKAVVFPNGRISYNNDDIWKSAIKDNQWDEFYQYSRTYGTRLVFLNEYPSNYTASVLYNNQNADVYQSNQIISAAPGTPNAETINSAKLDTYNIYHYPAVIQNSELITAEPLLYFGPNDYCPEQTVAAVAVNYSGAQYAAYFMAFGGWSKTSHALNILWLSWATEMDLKDLTMSTGDSVSTEQALLDVGSGNFFKSGAIRNGKFEILIVALSTLFSIFYLL